MKQFKIFSKLSKKLKNYITVLSNLKFTILHSVYSETGEDVIVSQLFGNSVGKFVDIGSGQPVIGNNTFLLYKMGWSGTCVDPQTHISIAYKFLRPRDRLINKPVSNLKKVKFFDFTNPLLSTTDFKVANFHIKNGLKYTEKFLDSTSMRDLLEPRISSDENFLLSIDVEGSELEIIKEIDFKKQRPRVILVESWKAPWTDDLLTKYMESVNYKLFAYTGLTSIYLPLEANFKVEKFRRNLANII